MMTLRPEDAMERFADGTIVHKTYKRICHIPIERRYSLYRTYVPIVEKYGIGSIRAQKQLNMMDQFDRKYGNFPDFAVYDRSKELFFERKQMLREFHKIALEEGTKFDLEVKRVMSEIEEYFSPSEFTSYLKEHNYAEISECLDMYGIYTSFNVCVEMALRFHKMMEEKTKFDREVEEMMSEIEKCFSPSEFARVLKDYDHDYAMFATFLDTYDIHMSYNMCMEVASRFCKTH